MFPRLVVFNQFALPRSAGGGTRHVELYGRLEGWDTEVFAARRAMLDQSTVHDDEILTTVWVSRFRGNGFDRLLNWASYTVGAVSKVMVGRKPDIVIGSSPHLGAALAGLFVARVRRSAFVFEVRDLWPEILVDTGMFERSSLPYRALDRLAQMLYRQADVIFVLAEGTGTYLVERGVPADKIEFVPNGAEVGEFDVDVPRAALRESYGLNGFVTVYAGAHGPANGLTFVLDAAEELKDELPDALFLLVGDGVSKPGLVEDAERRELKNVVFLDPIAKSKIGEVFNAADAGLHCLADVDLFTYGVSPNKLYDYMASGLPVITNTPGEVSTMVHDAASGVAVAPSRIADGVRELYALDAAERSALAASGREYMITNRSRSALRNRVDQIFVGLIEQRTNR